MIRLGAAYAHAWTVFTYLCAWLFPLWLLTASAAWMPALSIAPYGLTLTVLALLYLAISRVRSAAW